MDYTLGAADHSGLATVVLLVIGVLLLTLLMHLARGLIRAHAQLAKVAAGRAGQREAQPRRGTVNWRRMRSALLLILLARRCWRRRHPGGGAGAAPAARHGLPGRRQRLSARAASAAR